MQYSSNCVDSTTIALWRKQTNSKLRSEIGRKLRRIKGAKHANASMLAQGRVLCSEANEAHKRNAAARREAKARDAETKAWRSSSTDMTGV
jgi:hypothetical protein